MFEWVSAKAWLLREIRLKLNVARELIRVAETLSGRVRGLAGMQLWLTPSSKF